VGFEPRRSAGDDPFNAAVAWVQNLRSLKAADLRPTQALARLATAPGNPTTGRVIPGSEDTAPSLAILKELAAG
jgi:hypothetical protein